MPNERRLAVVLVADIVGFSRMMGQDEQGTMERLRRYRRDFIDPTIEEHDGRLFKTTGDGFLVEFASPLQAVKCAILIQQNMLGRNATVSRDKWIQFRIGINLGDVLVDESGDLHGDGVNIAARLEGIAEPGRVFISGGVYEQIKHKLLVNYDPIGRKHVKNISEPISVYRVLPDEDTIIQTRRRKASRIMRGIGVALLAVSCLAAGIFIAPRLDVQNLTWLNGGKQEVAGPPQPPREIPVVAALAPVPPEIPLAITEKPLPKETPPLVVEAPLVNAERPAQQETPPQAEKVPPPNPEQPAQKEEPITVVEAPRPPPVPETVQAARPALTPPPETEIAMLPPLSGAVRQPRLNEPFRDCNGCPEMMLLPGGKFRMGSREHPTEQPLREISMQSFAIGRYPVTVREWNLCQSCQRKVKGDPDSPAKNISWSDAQQYADWLRQTTEMPYRLPTEAEWEYAARGGSTTRYYWGEDARLNMANCADCGGFWESANPLPSASYPPNKFGLFEMAGGVAEWVEDCWHSDFQGAPKDAAAWKESDCRRHVLKGGSWKSDLENLRVSVRNFYDTDVRYFTNGVRVARDK